MTYNIVMTLLHPLQPGDTIGVFAPSSYVEAEDIEKSQAMLEQRGYKLHIHPQTLARHHQSAGTESEKAAAFHALWNDPDIAAIWAAGGGNRCLHLLPHLDIASLQGAKPVIGFSDVTALLNALYAGARIPSVHGQVFKNLHQHPALDQLLSLLSGGQKTFALNGHQVLHNGTATGALIGGNLTVFQALIGTEYMPDPSGAILFLEDTGEELSRFDRAMAHLKAAGILSAIDGLILGTFSNWKDSGRPYGFSFEEIVAEHTQDLDIPIITHAPFGHQGPFEALPIGARATMHTTNAAPLTIDLASMFA